MKALIPANLNISENKPGNQNPKKQTNSTRKDAKEPRQLEKQNRRLSEANLSITETTTTTRMIVMEPVNKDLTLSLPER
jgi:hypothetical protein